MPRKPRAQVLDILKIKDDHCAKRKMWYNLFVLEMNAGAFKAV